MSNSKNLSDQLREHLEQALDELKKLETRIRTATKDWKEKNPDQWEKLKRRRDDLKTELKDLDKKGGEIFDEMKKGFRNAVKEIEKALDNLRKKN